VTAQCRPIVTGTGRPSRLLHRSSNFVDETDPMSIPFAVKQSSFSIPVRTLRVQKRWSTEALLMKTCVAGAFLFVSLIICGIF
jgi:hypothetical protein